jgi:hypothetical protein
MVQLSSEKFVFLPSTMRKGVDMSMSESMILPIGYVASVAFCTAPCHADATDDDWSIGNTWCFIPLLVHRGS